MLPSEFSPIANALKRQQSNNARLVKADLRYQKTKSSAKGRKYVRELAFLPQIQYLRVFVACSV